MIQIPCDMALEWANAWIERELTKVERGCMEKVRREFPGAAPEVMKAAQEQARRLAANYREIAWAKFAKIIHAAECSRAECLH